jgi:hypothetical protein
MKTLYYSLFGLMLLSEFSATMRLITGGEISSPLIVSMLFIGWLAYFFYAKAIHHPQHLENKLKVKLSISKDFNIHTNNIVTQSVEKTKATLESIEEKVVGQDLINILPSLKNFSLGLEKKEIFIDRPWILVTKDGSHQKFIFKRNGELILSDNGIVTIGTWEYFPIANSLMINRIYDKILLKKLYSDDAIMVLKTDATSGQNFILANEQLIPSLNVDKYVENLYYSKNEIKTVELTGGRFLQIHNFAQALMVGLKVTINMREVLDCTLTTSKGNKIVIENSKIAGIFKYAKLKLLDDTPIVVEYKAYYESFIYDVPIEIGNKVYLGDEITLLPYGKYKLNKFRSFKVENGKITGIGIFL